MRKDMRYLVLDRPRINFGCGDCKGEKRKLQRAFEDAPIRESMRARWHFHNRRQSGARLVKAGREERRKQFNDYLAPLLGFLRSRVGRDWDWIDSELRQHADTGSVLGFHLLYHVHKLVYRHVLVHDERVCTIRGDKIAPGYFYVHPHTHKLVMVH